MTEFTQIFHFSSIFDKKKESLCTKNNFLISMPLFNNFQKWFYWSRTGFRLKCAQKDWGLDINLQPVRSPHKNISSLKKAMGKSTSTVTCFWRSYQVHHASGRLELRPAGPAVSLLSPELTAGTLKCSRSPSWVNINDFS